jgi:hypothetical protein
MKDAYFAHVAWVEANRHVFADVGCHPWKLRTV